MDKEFEGILDLRMLQEVCPVPGRLDDPGLVRLVALFIAEETPRLAGLPGIAEAGNGARLASESHRFAGSCAVIGATQAHRAAQELERAAAAGAWAEVPARLAAVQEAWIRLNAALAQLGLGTR
jgi:HPt (histidine-containing phosphotransfer) domain-containing protein